MNSSNKISDNTQYTRKPLSRSQIENAGNHPEVNTTLDDFDKDALQGWQKASGGMELMKPLDKKFNARSTWLYATLTVLTLIVIGTFVFLKTDLNEKPSIAQHVNKKTIDKSDVIIPADIEAFQELPEDLQIKPKQIVSNFKEKSDNTAERPNVNASPDEEIQITLPLKKTQVNAGKQALTIEKKIAKEIYLSDFKLVDYRNYRSRNAIPSQQMELSGTPANQEKNEIAEDDISWKAIDIPYHNYIAQTMEQFNSGNFKQTLNRTKFILGFYPDDINALFYGGLCYYNLSEMNQAIDAFEKVVSNPFSNFDEEAFWYLANAYYLNSDKTKAKELFQAIVNQKGYYAKQAEKMLKK